MLVRWLTDRQAQGKTSLKLEWFADEYTAFSKEAAQPIVDEHGCLTAYGERVTRPIGPKQVAS